MIAATPGTVQDLMGKPFGRLTVVGYEGCRRINGRPYHYWICRCVCDPGRVFPVRGESLRGDNTLSCGCLKRERLAEGVALRRKHGRSGTKEFRAWSSMIGRCYRLSDPHYPAWGGRGISVCDRWRDSFVAFLEDMGEAPSPGHTLERINNDGQYCKENCRWALHAEQARNTRRNRRLTFNGRTMILSDWAREIGLEANVLSTRLRRGWTVEEAISTPSSGFGGRRIAGGRRGDGRQG